jgi:signal transduction histidine kinase
VPPPDARDRGTPRLPRFARTLTFKLALVQTALFAASAAVLFLAVYVNLAGYARTQLRASITAELDVLAEERSSDGLDELAATIAARTRDDGTAGFAYLLRSADGTRLAGALAADSVRPGWQSLPASATPGRGRGERHGLEAFGQSLPSGELLVVARDVRDVAHVKEQVVRSFGVAATLTLALAIVSGVVTSLAALRRVEAINAITRGIMEGDLGRRVPDRGTGDEFDRLASNTNAMLDRIQLLMEGLRQVSNDIAHDLRTPLTHLRQRLEAARSGPRTRESYETTIDAASGDVDTILRIFASLLRIAQVEAGTRRSGFADIDASEVFTAIAEVYAPVAEDAGQTLRASVAPGVVVSGDRDLLTQMLANLVENAIRHAGPGSRIHVSLEREGTAFRGAVADTGPGIPGPQRERVFGRFVRLETSRPGEGSGLGLALVKAVADLHGIDVVLSDDRPGLRVTLRGSTLAASGRQPERPRPRGTEQRGDAS